MTTSLPALAPTLRLAGLELAGPLGMGSAGPRWAARDTDGRRWAVTVVRPGAGEPARLRERVRRLGEVVHPHLARVGPVVDLPDGGLALLEEEVTGPDLETVSSARGRWAPGEVVTVVVPLAGALAALHAAGLAHGDVSPANVVLGPGGRAVLVDVVLGDGPDEEGTPTVAAPERRDGARPPGDVHALARIGLLLLGPGDTAGPDGAVHDRVAGCLQAATAADPRRRPTAEELGRRLYAACPPAPVDLPEAAVLARTALRRLAEPVLGGRDRTGPVDGRRTVRIPARRATRGRHRGRRPRRRVLVWVALVLALGGTTVAVGGDVARVGARADASPTPAVVGGPAGADPAGAAVRLTVERARALATGDRARLARVTVPGSDAAASDLAVLGRLHRTGLPGPGPVRVEVQQVRRLPGTAGGARHGPGPGPVRVLLVARVTTGEPGASPAAVRGVVLVLTATPAGWRVSEVEAYDP